jgi:hypothetical protein
MNTAFARFLVSIEQSALGETIRVTPHLYPVVMALHVVGIAMLLGPAIAMDLRLMGVARHGVPVTFAMRYLMPICHAGFAVVALTGVTMFSAVAFTVGTSAAAPWKLALIGLAGLNILIFHRGVYRRVASWDVDTLPPFQARVAGLASLLFWTGTVFAGRFLAY